MSLFNMNLSRTWLARSLLIATSLGLTLCLVFIQDFDLTPNKNNSAPLISSVPVLEKVKELKPGLPVKLKIPIINIDTTIESVGLTPQGDMGVPNGIENSGWYMLGPRPGEKGSAVIDGHYGWIDGRPAVFNKINELVKGDILYIEDEEGIVTKFVVSASQTYNPSDDAETVFRSNDGKAHLNLITCQGIWENSQNTYSNRLVVFAEIEG